MYKQSYTTQVETTFAWMFYNSPITSNFFQLL